MLYFFLKRNRLIFFIFNSCIIFTLITGYIYGFGILEYYVIKVIPYTSKSWVILNINNQSLLGIISRLFGHTFESGRKYLIYAPIIIKPVFFSFFFLILFSALQLIKKNTDNKIFLYVIMLPAGVLMFGVNWHHTYSFVFFSVAYLLSIIINSFKKSGFYCLLIIWILFFILLNINIDYSAIDIEGWKQFLTIPNYFGTLILFITLFFIKSYHPQCN